MNNSHFKVGDTVRLKSGGPKMSVIDPEWSVDGRGEVQVNCVFFFDGEMKKASIPQKALEQILTDAPPE